MSIKRGHKIFNWFNSENYINNGFKLLRILIKIGGETMESGSSMN